MSLAHNEIEERDAERERRNAEHEAPTMLSYLANVRFETRWDLQDVEHYQKLPSLNAAQIERLKAMMWTYRRQLPRAIAPVLPPHDPIVQEMERNHAS
jgi:hypothetical protein